ncbi:MAG TPA: hypothetical protein VEI50_11045 [Nitrospiraceae bacterium]|nr:hypothetical protein [Nitrospiraceae bacterium]
MDIDRPPVGTVAPFEPFVEPAAVVAPAKVVVPVDELRGAIVFGVAVVIVVVAAEGISAVGTVVGEASGAVLLESEVSCD